MNGIYVLILEAALESFWSSYNALEVYQRLPWKIRVKLSLGETSAMDRQKCWGTHLTGLVYRVRITPVGAIARLWYQKNIME